MFSIFVQQLINGVSLGAAYAIFAIGFTLIFGVLNVLNMAQGALFMWGAYVGLSAVTRFGLPVAVALVTAMALTGLLAVSTELIAFRPLRARGANRWMGMIASLAIARILIGLAQIVFGTQVLRFPPQAALTATWNVAGVRIQTLQVAIVCVAVVLMVAVAFLLQMTRTGRAICTVAFSERVAALVGISVARTTLATFFLAGALAGAAGVLLGLTYNVVSPFMGENMLLKGLTVMILGGLGSVPGAVVGAFFLGLVEVMSVGYLSSSFRDAIGFGLVFLILLVRPSGLFGSTAGQRA